MVNEAWPIALGAERHCLHHSHGGLGKYIIDIYSQDRKTMRITDTKRPPVGCSFIPFLTLEHALFPIKLQKFKSFFV